MSESGASRLHMVAVLPPPVTGQTLATLAMGERFEAALPLIRWCVRKSGPRLWRVKKHVGLARMLAAAAGQSGGQDRLYMVPDKGPGLRVARRLAPLMARAFSQVILHHHGFAPLRTRDPNMAALIDTLGSKGRHIVLGRPMAGGLIHHYGVPCDRIDILGNTALVIPPPVPGPPGPRPETLGFLGNVTAQKGLCAFLDTVRALVARGHPVGALIAGPVADAALAREIAGFIAEDPARRAALGPVEGAGKTAFFSRIDALLFPSTYPNEALPLTVLEALSAARPVLATPCGTLPDQLPEAWLLPACRFAQEAATVLAGWRDDPDGFAMAARTARLRWGEAQARDAAALERLLARLGAVPP